MGTSVKRRNVLNEMTPAGRFTPRDNDHKQSVSLFLFPSKKLARGCNLDNCCFFLLRPRGMKFETAPSQARARCCSSSRCVPGDFYVDATDVESRGQVVQLEENTRRAQSILGRETPVWIARRRRDCYRYRFARPPIALARKFLSGAKCCGAHRFRSVEAPVFVSLKAIFYGNGKFCVQQSQMTEEH